MEKSGCLAMIWDRGTAGLPVSHQAKALLTIPLLTICFSLTPHQARGLASLQPRWRHFLLSQSWGLLSVSSDKGSPILPGLPWVEVCLASGCVL